MSRIGRLPIPLKSGVKAAIDGDTVTVQGPRGQVAQTLPRGISAAIEEQELLLRRRDDSKVQKALHGLSRALLANAVHGVTVGFEKRLEIHGVGYRAELAGKTLKLSLGFSHPVEFPVPEGIKIAVEKNTMITVGGVDRQRVGQVAADIRKFRPPDVYKQKGIRYADERLRKKAGKTAAK
jgi:large subunit ribosomal protein L6